VHRDPLNGTIGKDLLHLQFEVLSLVASPEIVGIQKTTAIEILSKALGIFGAEVHAPRFDNVDKRKFEQLRIHYANDVGIRMHTHSRQTMNATHELAVAAGIINAPAPPLRRKEIAAAELRTLVLLLRNRHGYRIAAEPAKTS